MNNEELKAKAREVRKGILTGTFHAKSGHPGGSLSAADIYTWLFFEEMKVEEICRVMKKNRKQIYNLADRGRRALKEKLGDVQRDLLS